jgi:endonuclease YncB( thermonuclease family)
MYSYSATIIRWVDGDTLWLTAWREEKLDLGFRNRLTIRHEHDLECRVYGIDTPEDSAGKPATRAVNAWAPAGSNVTIETFKPLPEDKYGRWLADIRLEDGRSISAELLSHNLGVAYFGGKKAAAV